MNEGDASQTAAEMRSLVDQAEAEAAEAQAIAAAARARASQVRRKAELAEIDASTKLVADKAIPAESATSAAATEVFAKPANPTDTNERDTRKPKLIKTNAAAQLVGGDAVDVPEERASQQSTAASSELVEGPGVSTVGLRRPKLSEVTAVLAVIVSCVALGASVEMAVLHKNANRERQLVAEYSAAARQGVVTLTSLNFEHAEEGVRNILEVSTGTFRDEFLKTAEDFTKVVERSNVISQGAVQATAVDLDSLTDNSALVLVASTTEITNADGNKQDSRKYRVVVTVTRYGGQIKMSNVEFVP